jgi:hypothetical protein
MSTDLLLWLSIVLFGASILLEMLIPYLQKRRRRRHERSSLWDQAELDRTEAV